MIACQFIFEPGEYDEDFYRLDTAIDDFAHRLPGFRGVEKWRSENIEGVLNHVYYFADESSVRELARFPDHLQAKREVTRWYRGYRIVISAVQRSYGDGNLTGLTDLS